MSTLHILRPHPLPYNNYNPSTQAPLHDAYEECLMMEASVGTDKDALVFPRCLGYLILELPHEAGEVVAHEVVDCHASFDRMRSLSLFYIDHLIRLFRQSKGPTPAPSEHPSRPSFEMHRNFFNEAVEPAPASHQAAKKSALRRDGYRCVVTGQADRTSVESMQPADLQKYNLDDNSVVTITNYCHIFPPSTNRFDQNDPAEKKKKYAGSVWSIIESFSHIDMLSELNSESIHHLQNGFTMHSQLHTLFDDLNLWFEHVAGLDNTYKVCFLSLRDHRSFLSTSQSHTITFTSTDPSLPLPNPDYLRLHAAVCRVAHMSGAAGYLDLEDRKVEKLKVLACDGSSADLLSSCLAHVALMA
ncbi:hypothetical protein HYPSUDRAFT_69697 [Hypholoma sublateritium FD-334 SS-4]|uniref:HNH nuclease domain-containing protein n=1 Tax=Hypholoma sublateritium (strain FD-334 SS-4) TaxID=945553 RepID=A0A0D2M6I9_HYPSF|nr:hypothetical protein HYPSUDRAFT_69697 [Hypholoma sublateritium FD-334 SS-4]